MAYDPLFSGGRHGHRRNVFTMPVIVATIPTNACALVAAVSGEDETCLEPRDELAASFLAYKASASLSMLAWQKNSPALFPNARLCILASC